MSIELFYWKIKYLNCAEAEGIEAMSSKTNFGHCVLVMENIWVL